MGKKTKLRKTEATSSTKDIGALLRDYSDSGLEESEQGGSQYSAGRVVHSKRPPHTETDFVITWASTVSCPKNIPASKADIQNMLAEMKLHFSADIAIVRQDMGTWGLQPLEDERSTSTDKQEELTADIDQLKQITLTMEGKITVLEDAKRQQNLRLCGVPKDIRGGGITLPS
ncbi:Hypothetical predicted protein [Pelobates cultripes]|uniref:Uncharacterized protein n=1 Tax=Pelobates cultripes TaxID=61616 RepID=A0AAD1R493_PELCU|nr:Hypothetical predicted protein [Pelobates cultripes]